MSVSFSIDQRGLQRAMTTYAVRRRKSDADVVNKAMRYVLPAAARRVKDKTPGGIRIRRELTGRAKRIGRGKSDRDALANTVAAAIVAGTLRKKNPNAVLPRRKDADAIDMGRINDFYERVRRLVNAKVRSANFLRAGFIPAFRQFMVPNRGVPGQQRFKGRSKGIKALPSLLGVAEAYATNQREGAFKIAPRAFHEAVRDTRRLFLKWIKDDMNAEAKRSGFY
jgi:hypothetical protein